MKRPRGGTLFLVLTPDELLARIATLVPPPRSHALRYHGLFAPNSKHRARVVPSGGLRKGRGGEADGATQGRAAGEARPAPAGPAAAPPALAPRKPDQPEPTGTSWILTAPDGPPGRSAPRYRIPWAELLQRVFAVDVLECPRCAGRLELIAFIAAPDVARRILDHLGLAAQAPPLAPARPPEPDEPTRDPGPDYHAADPSFDD
jgi:hypothetical protein